MVLQTAVSVPTNAVDSQQHSHADERADALAEELYKVLTEVFQVLGRRDLGGVLPGDLTLAQLSILMTLQERGPMRMTALASYQRVRTPTVTVAIRRLEKLGLVERSRDLTDLRAVVVGITPHGHAMRRNALAARQMQFAAMLTTLSPEDRVSLKDALSPLERLASQDNP
jgi:DNA-binding MarR family transcriptional regulator